ncbi:MAG: two-component regulator propeller domain-containing protein [Bacteroidota bacterium]|nr:two-component regulator propeller domain-containing protein [Bacteroidota bacterium]
MCKKLFILTVLSILQLFHAYSQTPSYYHYTSSDGLASSTVYQIIQDNNGYIWFGTVNGMSKFDGQHFTTYRTNEGLNSNSIISLAEGINGDLYIGNYEKGINVMRNGLIEDYCSVIDGKGIALSYLLLMPSGDNNQKLYAYRSTGNIYSIESKSSGSLITDIINSYRISVNKLELLPNGEIIALTASGLYHFKDDKLTKISVSGLPDTEVLLCLAKGDSGSYLVGKKGMIYQIKKNEVVRRIKIDLFDENNDVNEMYSDKNNNLWFSVMNRGFFFIPAGTDEIIDVGSKLGLQHTLVNNYLEDNEGNIWISTFGKGVFCLNNLYIKSYSENDGLSSNSVYAIEKEKSGKLLIGTFNGLNILENGIFGQVKSNSGKSLTENISSIRNENNDFYICGSFGNEEFTNSSYKGIKLHLLDQSAFFKTSDGLYLFGGWANTITIQKELNPKKENRVLFPIIGDKVVPNRINDIFEDSRKNIWVGTGLGLCMISNFSDQSDKSAWKKSLFLSNPVLNSRIKLIFQDAENKVWIIGEKGIASFDLTTESVKTYISINGFDVSSATSLAWDGQKRIWIGTMKGLFLWDGNSVRQLNRQTGLPSDEVLSLLFDKEKNRLYIGTSSGISFLDIRLFDSYSPKPLDFKLLRLKAGDSIYTSFTNLVFEPKQNHVYIEFKAISFSSPGSVRYKYILNGEWEETDHDFLDFVSLKSGNYNLQIIAKSQNTDWSKPYFLSFRVLPRFVETIWFTILIILTLGFFSVVFMIWILRVNRKKSREEFELSERINDLKHQALSAMMNPHFIFNSLNSVQYLINCQRNEEANDYIAMMAKLIRKNLDTAGSGFILLAEEMNRLTLYLDLEKLRFKEGFSYEVITGNDIEPNSILIPNMIIQPFVENTLWHGIINSGSKGLVTILFSFEDVEVDSAISRSLIIKVTDNGIGINNAKKNKKEDHISKGIQIIEERLRLLSAKMQLPQPIMLEDLSNRNIDSHGTEVIISLPPQLYKMITPESDFTPSITV